MAEPRPSMTLILDIDERIAESETKLELARCFNYLGAPLVRAHAPASEDDSTVNTARMLVKMGTKKYLYADDEGADERWEKSDLPRWFHNEFYKIGNNMKIFNRRQREIGMPEVRFDWLVVELQNGACDVFFRLDSNSDIPADQSAILEAVRAALNDGSLGDGRTVKEIKMPTEASYELQAQAAVEERARREEERKAEEAEAAARAQAEAEAAEAAAEEAFLESPAKIQAEKLEERAHAKAEEDAYLREHATPEGAQRLAEQEELTEEEALKKAEEEWERKFSFPEVDFELDYNLWDVIYEDGTSRTYNMQEHALVQE